jgi:ABC-2 type transport system permease protein
VNWLRAFRAQLITAFALTTTYRAEIVLWALSGSLPIILMGVWGEAARSGRFGYTPIDMVRYFVAVLVVRQLTFVWVIWEFEESVVSGSLSHHLLRPIDPVWNLLANHLAERIARFPLVLVMCALCFWLHPGSFFVPDLASLGLAALAIALAFACRFVMQFTVAINCFFSERASSLESLAFVAYTFLSGMLAPLDLYPEAVQSFARWTPFPYLVFVPARLLLGDHTDVARAIGVPLAWTLGFLLLQRWLWRKGLARYSAMGA